MNHATGLFLKLLRCLTWVTLTALPAAYADAVGDTQALLQANKLPEALAAADAHLAQQPADPRLRFIKGVVLRKLGRTDESIAVLTQLTLDYPELPEPYNNLAVIYASQGQLLQARVALESALRNNPNYAVAQENLGDVYVKLAAQSYARALQVDASNAALQPKLSALGAAALQAAPAR